jgi:hypothetical protein
VQHRNGNGKRWLLVAALIIGGIWLINDAYRDGYSDALVRSGKVTAVTPIHDGPLYYAGGGFPWGLLIIGGLIYFAWRKGFFGGPGRYGPGNGNGNGGHRYGGYTPAQMTQDHGARQHYGPEFRGPRAFFEEWHRQSHEAEAARQHYQDYPAPPAPPASPSPPSPAAPQGNGNSGAGTATPPPPAPSAEYWAAMGRAAGEAGHAGAPVAPPAAPAAPPAAPAAPPAAPAAPPQGEGQQQQPDDPRGTTGTPV